jgi:hypothetical protein
VQAVIRSAFQDAYESCEAQKDLSSKASELLGHRHIEGLAASSSAGDPSLYQWSPVPQGKIEVMRYLETALSWKDAGTAVT